MKSRKRAHKIYIFIHFALVHRPHTHIYRKAVHFFVLAALLLMFSCSQKQTNSTLHYTACRVRKRTRAHKTKVNHKLLKPQFTQTNIYTRMQHITTTPKKKELKKNKKSGFCGKTLHKPTKMQTRCLHPYSAVCVCMNICFVIVSSICDIRIYVCIYCAQQHFGDHCRTINRGLATGQNTTAHTRRTV